MCSNSFGSTEYVICYLNPHIFFRSAKVILIGPCIFTVFSVVAAAICMDFLLTLNLLKICKLVKRERYQHSHANCKEEYNIQVGEKKIKYNSK